MKKIISLIFSLILSIGLISNPAYKIHADDKSQLDSLKSKYIVLMDYDTGNVLYEKNPNDKIYPASTTKIWTAFCVLKKCNDVNHVIEVKDMPQVEGSCMYLENGEKFTVMQLLESLLIHSSNDVAYLLAKTYGDGNPQNFINFMNEEAKKYGAENTHFNNPHGLPDENHYSTAMDMTNLSRVAYSNPVIQKIVAMRSVSFKANNIYKFDRQLFNTNKFLSSLDNIDYKGKQIPIKYEIVDGIKTGYTDDAGNCLVSTAKKGDTRLICGVFKSPGGSLYHDSRAVLDYGFDNFKEFSVLKKSDVKGEKTIWFSIPNKIRYTIANDFVVTVPKDENVKKSDYKVEYKFNNIKLPVKKGSIIGSANIFQKGNLISSIALVSDTEAVSYPQFILTKLGLEGSEKKDKNSNADADSNKKAEKKTEKTNDKEVKKDSKEKNKDREDNKDEKSKSENSRKEKTDTVKNAKDTVTSSFNGFIGLLSDIGSSITSFFTKDGVSSIENTDFYKFLDKAVSSHIRYIPSKVIIFGIPLFIILVVIILIIGIIRDRIKSKKSSKKEMNVSDIVTKNENEDNKK